MNRIHRIIWSEIKSRWIVVSEKAGSKGCPILTFGALSLAALVSTARPAMGLDPGSLPTGGAVVAGSGTITTDGLKMTVRQNTPQLIANWSSFNIGEKAGVEFVQPGQTATALNRISDENPSVIMGSLTSNGQLFLLNRSGVIFGRTARVDVGGLLASSLNLLDSDFLAGRYKFTGEGGAGAVINRGEITARQGGVVALMAPTVSNEGTISAQGGSVLLAAANEVTLDFGGDGLISYTIDKGAVDAQVLNSGLVKVDRGMVVMTAQAADALTTAAVNNTGIVEARTLQNRGGRILLLADMERGTTTVAGTLDASAPEGGDGGFVETSGGRVKISDGTVVDTHAVSGSAGTWLIDPADFTIASGKTGSINGGTPSGDVSGQTLSNALGSGNVTILSSQGSTANGYGDINVNDTVSWSANTTLTLTAARNICINAQMTLTGSSNLAMNPATTNTTGVVTDNSITGGTVLVGMNSDGTFKGKIDFFQADGVTPRSGTGHLSIGGTGCTLVSSLSALQGITGGLAGSYALGADISGSNFTAIGTTSSRFTGQFEGLGHTISNLAITGTTGVGLFGAIGPSATIRNLILDLGSSTISGVTYVGGLVGYNTGGTINNSVVNGGTLTASGNYAGGLVGYNSGGLIMGATVRGSTLSGSGSYLGGLVGGNTGTVSASSVTDTNVTSSYAGNTYAGGLAGSNSGTLAGVRVSGGSVKGITHLGGLVGSNTGTVSGSSVTGSTVTSTYNADAFVGGLAGANSGTLTGVSVTSATVKGKSYIGGMAGTNAGTIVDASVTNATVNGSSYIGGMAGYNAGTVIASGVTDTSVTGTYSDSYLGGLVGYNSGTLDRVSVTNATVSAVGQAGGLVGRNAATGIVVNSSVTGGTVTGVQYIGGMAGYNAGILSASNVTDVTVTSTYNVDPNLGGLAGFNSGTLAGVHVTNASVTAAGQYVGGLVGNNTGTLSSASVTNATVKGKSYIGGMAGYNAGTVIASGVTDTSVTGTYNGDSRIGGIVGYNSGMLAGVNVTNATVSAAGQYVGGMVGYNNGMITAADVYGATVSGSNYIGGLVGRNYSPGNISASNVTNSTVNGSGQYVGGLVGDNTGTLSSVTASGTTVTGHSYVGGLVGSNGGNIDSVSLTDAKVYGSGTNYVGGLAGLNTGTIYNSRVAGGTVSGSINMQDIGGLVGRNSAGGMISGSGVSGTALAGTRANVDIGGLVGQNFAAISQSGVTSVTITGTNYIGGMVGLNVSGGTVNGGTVTNATLSGTNATSSYIGGLVGYLVGGSITGSSVIGGSVKGAGQYVGGLVGAMLPFSGYNFTGAAIVSSNVSGTRVSGSGNNVGGLLGANAGSLSAVSVTDAAVAGVGNIGGLVGSNMVYTTTGANYTGTIVSSGVVGGSVSGAGQYVGGFAGINSNSVICGSISVSGTAVTGSYSGAGYIGGLVGANTGTLSSATVTSASVAGSTSTSEIGGLVGRNSGGTINDSGVLGGSVSGLQYIGGLVGDNSSGVLSGVSVSGTTVSGSFSGSGYIGGLAGYNAGTLTNVAATSVAVSGASTTDRVGGLVGRNSGVIDAGKVLGGSVSGRNDIGGLVGYQDGSAIRSYATSTVTGSSDVGGLVGGNYGSVSQSYAIGTVSGSENVGGLVGLQGTSSSIVDSYAAGLVRGTNSVGGLAGRVTAGTISRSYALGVVNGSSFAGALIGQRSAGVTIANTCYNTDINVGMNGVGGTSPDLTGVTGADSSALRSFSTYSGYDFTSVWNIDSTQTNTNLGYPYLRGLDVAVGVYVVPSGSSVYGDQPTVPSYIYDSAANGNGTDIANASPTGTPVWTTLPGQTSPAGSYDLAYVSGITLGTPGYWLYLGLPGTWTVQKAPLGVTVSGVYSGSTTIVPTSFSVNGLKNSETIDSLTSATLHSKEVSANGSNYVTSLSIGSGSASMDNYALSLAYNATVGTTRNMATLSRKALNLTISKTYDGNAEFEKTDTYSLDGYCQNDSVVLNSGIGAVCSKDAGSYTSFVSGGFALDNNNYTLDGGAVSATIGRASATVTGNSASGTYSGVAQGVSGFTVTGLVNNESASMLTSPTASGATGTNVGSYSNTVSGNMADGNYNLTFVNGTLTIGRASATVTGNSASGTY
ncbi:MAG: filamentous hemagglutinin N-terminal domain-containing protein, partial [Chlorobiaceae bacterium]|nr:filamentous hemagglutinin N-terminal domain-containing protein [Chlorobiaceae bacterium]